MTTARKRLVYFAAGVVVLVVAAVFGWYIFSGNAPDEATLGDAAEVVRTTAAPDTSTSSTSAAISTTTIAPETVAPTTTTLVGLDGVWSVDTTIGEFSFQDATSAFAGFRVEEQLSGIGATEAVGRTPDVSGSIEIDGSMVTTASFTAQLATLTTDRSRRDSAVHRALGTSQFPEASFGITSPIDLGSVPGDGETVAATALGELTIRGITQPAEFGFEAQLVDGVIVVVGQIPVVFADFGVSVPSAPVVVSAADNGVIEVQLFLTR